MNIDLQIAIYSAGPSLIAAAMVLILVRGALNDGPSSSTFLTSYKILLIMGALLLIVITVMAIFLFAAVWAAFLL